jgi:hypothetical protein
MVGPAGSPKVFYIVHAPKTQVEPSCRNRRVIQIAFLFEDTQGRFADPEVGRAKNHGTNARRLLDRTRGPSDPVSLLFVSGCPKVLVLLQASMSPSVRTELVPSFVTVTDQMGIRFGKTAGKKDGRGHMIPVATIEEGFKPPL